MTTIASPTADNGEGGFLALMRHRNYALLWTGQLVSLMGDRFHWVAISLWVFAQTGSALSVSYAIIALMLAPALVGFYAGVLVDRLDRRKILVAADLTRAVLVAAIPWLMQQGIAWVYVDLFLVSAASAFFRPAMFAAIPQSVPRERLLQANAFFASMDSATEVFGPALAGLLVAQVGYAAVMYVDAASYLVSAACVAGLRLVRVGSANAGKGETGAGVFQSIREGLQYIRRDSVHVALLALLLAGQWVVGLSSLQTPLAKGVLGITDRQFGWFQSIWGMGLVGASLMMAWYGRYIPRGQTIVLAYLLWAVATGAMGLSTNYGMLVVTGFWVGLANMLMFVNVATLMMEHTPPDKIGRAITVRQVGVSLVRVCALLGFGWMADLVGVRAAVVTMAGLSLVGSAATAVRFPTLWRYQADRVRPTPVGPAAAREPTMPGVAAAFSRLIRARDDAQFVYSEQHWLNLVSLAIVGTGWLVLLATFPVQALGVAASVAGAVAAARLVRLSGDRLRARAAGHDSGEGKPGP